MSILTKYVHTNLIAEDWRSLARFYQEVFGCEPVPPERDFQGATLDAGIGLRAAHLRGLHMCMPGHGESGPTLEILSYDDLLRREPAAPNRPGFGHIAFSVEDVTLARKAVLDAGGHPVGEVVTLQVATGARVTWCYVTDPEGNIVELQSWSGGETGRGAEMSPHEAGHSPDHQAIIDRFVAACAADDRVIAVTLYGSRARGAADEHSDLDLGVITTDEAYDDFIAGREDFIRLLGEPLFIEDFGSSVVVLFILSDGAEVELALGRASEFKHDHGGPYIVLLDKKELLAGATFPRKQPLESEQVEALRQQVFWFWHDLSHFTTALARGQLWWACGQLEVLRLICVNLARLRHDFADPDVGHDPYFKIENAIPVEQLVPLETTFCPMEGAALFEAALVIVEYYREVARPLAQAHGINYPAELDRLVAARLNKLKTA